MKNKYPHIFEPITVRRMTVKNRIVMTPMGTNYGEQNGEMSFLHINYYEQRAKGGTGLIIVENASVDSPQGSNGTTQLRIDLDINNYNTVQEFIDDIVWDNNNFRPSYALNYKTPIDYKTQLGFK
jgi:2,4-dienoyl-CoA reductase-like NADH-dependent reductase (Old Yellow Enzyme family)